ncbi:hypothetical protein [Micromonospora sp. NPDC004704]
MPVRVYYWRCAHCGTTTVVADETTAKARRAQHDKVKHSGWSYSEWGFTTTN